MQTLYKTLILTFYAQFHMPMPDGLFIISDKLQSLRKFLT